MENKSLTQGEIFSVLVKLALPIMGTSFIQMAYNMIDMIWIGVIGMKAVAAVGTAGFFLWLSMAFVRIPNTGAAVGVAQAVGRNNDKVARRFISNSVEMSIVMAVLYSIFLIAFRHPLIAFFNLNDALVEGMAESYLLVVAFGMIFSFLNPVLTSVFTGYGDSKTPFLVNTVGLIINIVLDPILIFGVGPFPELGVVGAAIATVLSQAVVTALFLYYMVLKEKPIKKIRFFRGFDLECVREIFRLGFPVGMQSGLFTIIAIVLARLIAGYGPAAIAVQKVGTQVEALSWMSASGFATALSAFVGQNYGADQYERVKEGVYKALKIMSVLGILTSALLIIFPRQIFWVFIREEETLIMGAEYLRILGVSQLFMCVEITIGGAFNGLGRTIPPSIVSIVFTAARIPMAIILSTVLAFGLNGIWWSISISSIIKGVILFGWFLILQRRYPTYRPMRREKNKKLNTSL